jgi:transposase-like protein
VAKDTRIKKGQHLSPSTEFKKGQHWRPDSPHRHKDFLVREYVVKKRSASEIAEQFGINPPAIYFWLRRHGIERRTVSQARSIKHWGQSGELEMPQAHGRKRKPMEAETIQIDK